MPGLVRYVTIITSFVHFFFSVIQLVKLNLLCRWSAPLWLTWQKKLFRQMDILMVIISSFMLDDSATNLCLMFVLCSIQ